MSEVWIIFIQINKKDPKNQNFFSWIALVGIPSNSTNINNTLIKNQNGRVKLNEIETLMEKMNHYK